MPNLKCEACESAKNTSFVHTCDELRPRQPKNIKQVAREDNKELSLDDKTKEQTDYLFNQIEPFLDWESDESRKDVKKIIYKTLKVFNQGR
jgi:hypothetical protein